MGAVAATAAVVVVAAAATELLTLTDLPPIPELPLPLVGEGRAAGQRRFRIGG